MTREERKARTREDLLAAASRAFAEQGLHGASVDGIAEEAGYSTGAVYSNFAGKEELFLTLLEEVIARFARGHVDASAEGGDTLEGRVTAASVAWMRSLEERPLDFLLIIELWAYAVRNPDVRGAFAERYDRVRENLAALIDRIAVELGLELTMPARDLAAAVDALADGFALQKLAAPDAVPDALVVDAIRALFTGAVR
jgi:AcrR family transcriptional regulator